VWYMMDGITKEVLEIPFNMLGHSYLIIREVWTIHKTFKSEAEYFKSKEREYCERNQPRDKWVRLC
jgi:hypothetical protein